METTKTNRLNHKKYFLFLFFCFSFIALISAEDIKEIKIGQIIKDTMELDESHKYYKLIIPKNESNRILIVSTHEDITSRNKDMKDYFSDPDIYISKKNKYPSSRKSSEWFSEQYGADILSIPAESVEMDDVFYIGMYCEYKCKYVLKIETGIETELKLNEYFFINLKPKETINYKIKINNDYEKLKVMAYSTTGGKFKMFMNRNSPSSINTYKVIPSWEGGYMILIHRDTNEYCNNCEYHVIIHNAEEEEKSETNQIYLYVIMEDKDYKIDLYPVAKIFDAMEGNSKVSFRFNITEREKREEKLIIDIVLFSGSATLLIEGWRSKNAYSLSEVEKSPYLYNIVNEKYIILDRKDFEKFDQEEYRFSGKNSILYFSLFSASHISYTIQAYYLTSLNSLIQNNILIPGNQLKGYLLKNQIISYELFTDNQNKMKYNSQSNITITINKIVGKISSYGYFCKDEQCFINKKSELEKLEDKNRLIKPKQDSNPLIATLNIPYKENECLNDPIIKTEKGNIIKCATYAIIKCDEPNEESELCIYDIQFKIQDTEILMKQKQVYYGQIYNGKNDRYRITISDKDVENLFVVLNSESGDAQLSVFLVDETSYNKETLLSISDNNDYIPDVVQINKKVTGRNNLIGKYIVNVYPETFSTYQLYYYVTYKKESFSNYMMSRGKKPEVTMNLKIGTMLVDYFPNDIRYKIYSYTIMSKNENIKIFINRVNIDFDIYIFTDFNSFEIEKLSNMDVDKNLEQIKGYKYKSTTNNEVIIPKKDMTNYYSNKMIYILIAPSEPLKLKDKMNGDLKEEQKSKENLNINAISKFYIGISTENTPLSINEGMPHTMTLSNSYSHQIYQKIHTDPKKEVKLILSVLMGEIDIFASTKFLTEEEINNINIKDAKYNVYTETYEAEKIRFKLNVNSFTFLDLDKNFIKMENKVQTYIYYYIRRSESMVKENKICQYRVLEKSSDSKGQILQPGVVLTSKLEVGKKEYFIVEEIEKRKWAYINVIFKKGSGNVYLRIPKNPESHSNIRFPNEGSYDYKGRLIFSGRIISIPEEEFNKLDSKKNKLQLLITVTAETGTESSYSDSDSRNRVIKNEVEYTISYSNEPKRINQNEPYDGYITQGEFQYFNLYFDKSTQNIYIGLTNMNGDADLYLNRGNILPTTDKFDWSSTEMEHEYIDIGKDDPFFQDGKKNISGYYTLLLVGYIDTSYSLFVSSHEKKVFPLRNNIPMTCWCENKGEKCFFRYNSVFNKNNLEAGLDHNEVIFTSQYLYGSGFMYSKVFVDSELHNSQDFYKSFPDSTNYDYSNKESNQLNYIKVKVKGEKYTKDSSILLTFECKEKTKVDITSTSLTHYSSVDYILENRENIYYLGINDLTKNVAKLTLIFNNYVKDQDLIYSVHSYMGDAHFKLYGNSSVWDVQNQKVYYDYKLLKEFDLITNDKYQDSNLIDVYNPYTHDYHNFIPKSDKEKYDDIYLYVEPKNEFGFYVQYNFEKNWNKIQIGKEQTFYVANGELFGYFDITEEYENIEFTLNVNQNFKIYAELYVKMNIIDKNEVTQIKKNPQKKNDEFSLYHYSIPSAVNYDYMSVTDKALGTISLALHNLPKLTEEEIEKGNKIIRALFYIHIGNRVFEPIKEDTTRDKNKNYNHFNNEEINEESNTEASSDSNTIVNIYIAPGINNFKYMELKQYEYYFSNLTNTMFFSKSYETKVYSLTVEKPEHDIMVIEINSCYGSYEINIQTELITKDNLNQKSLEYTDKIERGKQTIYIENLKSKHYYLSIKSKGNRFFCRLHGYRKENECGNNLAYLIYYYTTFSENLSFQDIDRWIIHRPYGKGKVKLDLPIVITKDIESKEKEISDYKIDIYATNDNSNTYEISNICRLSRLILDNKKYFKIESVTVENKSSLILSDLEPTKNYYINLLVQNTKTKELISFQPFEIIPGGRRSYYQWGIIRKVLFVLLIIILIIFIYKYRKTKEELIFLKGEAVTKTEQEFAGMNKGQYDSEGIKYSTLSSGY